MHRRRKRIVDAEHIELDRSAVEYALKPKYPVLPPLAPAYIASVKLLEASNDVDCLFKDSLYYLLEDEPDMLGGDSKQIKLLELRNSFYTISGVDRAVKRKKYTNNAAVDLHSELNDESNEDDDNPSDEEHDETAEAIVEDEVDDYTINYLNEELDPLEAVEEDEPLLE